MVLNSNNPYSEYTRGLANELEEKYNIYDLSIDEEKDKETKKYDEAKKYLKSR